MEHCFTTTHGGHPCAGITTYYLLIMRYVLFKSTSITPPISENIRKFRKLVCQNIVLQFTRDEISNPTRKESLMRDGELRCSNVLVGSAEALTR
jgi:hypothetical protein